MYEQQRHVVARVCIGQQQRALLDVADHRGDHLAQHVVGVSCGVAVVEVTVQPPYVVI